MKTIEIKLYSFDELSEEAKERAINHFRKMQYSDPLPWSNEISDTIEKFCNIFDIDYRTIDYTEPYRNDYRLNFDDNIKSLSGVRLLAYLWNNYKKDLFKGKYYSVKSEKRLFHKRITSKKLKNGNIFNAYYSAIQLDDCCVLTGVCYDDDILKPIYEFMNKPNERIDFETLINDCFYSLCHSVNSEIEYRESDEGIIEEINNNDYEFTKDGKLY